MRLIVAPKVIQENIVSAREFHRHNTPEYAILSHTWKDGHEVTYDDCKLAPREKEGYSKIWNACHLALKDGIEYVWVDTCCINKSSSAELTESINSMFKWYQRASVCYAHLSDLEDITGLGDCRWFRRGWTLQELIAPRNMRSFDRLWHCVGDKRSLLGQLSTLTRISEDILRGTAPVSSACVAQRFFWAANRETTRDEDIAYCLLGIFYINMPMLYGEGDKAFFRLQEEIIRTTPDMSILAWSGDESSDGERRRYGGFLARSPSVFYDCSRVFLTRDALLEQGDMAVTNKGIRVTAPDCRYSTDVDGRRQYALRLNCARWGRTGELVHLSVPMRMVGLDIFARAQWDGGFKLVPLQLEVHDPRTMTLLAKEPSMPPLLSTSEAIRWRDDIVPINRVCGVHVEFLGNLKPSDIYSASPRRFWDAQDCMFFSPDDSAKGWGSLMLDGGCALFFFYWGINMDFFQGTLLDTTSEVGRLLGRELLLPAEQLDYRTTHVLDLLSVSGACWGQQGSVNSERRRLVVSFKATLTRDESICRRDMWKVEIKSRRVWSPIHESHNT